MIFRWYMTLRQLIDQCAIQSTAVLLFVEVVLRDRDKIMFLVDIQLQLSCDGPQELFPIDATGPHRHPAPAKMATFSSSSSLTNVSTNCSACLSMVVITFRLSFLHDLLDAGFIAQLYRSSVVWLRKAAIPVVK